MGDVVLQYIVNTKQSDYRLQSITALITKLSKSTTNTDRRRENKMGSETSKIIAENNNKEAKEGRLNNDDLTDCLDLADCIDVDCVDGFFQCLTLPFKICFGLCLG